ncbi:MAG: LCP family protein [Bacteroidales bacterium]|nr:LCP family protein [Clostridium sp.]MCM1202892.1 LCP family protein [Bacteroidales bacterium]
MSNSQRSRRNRARNKRLGLILLLEIVIFIGLVAGYAWYYINHTLNKMNKPGVKDQKIDVSDAVTETMDENYMTIALFGLDTRESASSDMTKEGVAHSDAVILASINKKTKEVKLVSVYRDCFLEISHSTATTEKYTHAYFLGGPTCAVETLNKNLDLNITDYVSVDFQALTNAIDALGGITIDVKDNEINNLNNNLQEQIMVTGISSDGVWSSGPQTLNGSQATAYARIRKVGNDDFERTQRQRAVIAAMIDKAKQSDLKAITGVIDEIFPLIATNMSNREIISLASSIFDYELGENTGFPLAHQTPTLGTKGSVVVPTDLLSNVEHLHEFLYPEDEEYSPSAEVRRISAAITAETGYGDEFTDDKTTEEPTQTNSGQ